MTDETDFETCFETSGAGRTERLEVIETPGGRRRWTPEARARIIAESLEPGVNVSEVARRHGMYPQQLYTWPDLNSGRGTDGERHCLSY